LSFQEPLPRNLDPEKTTKAMARQIAKINFLNKKKTDGFMEHLLVQRKDLAGLQFAMGDACRMKEGQRELFAHAVEAIRTGLQKEINISVGEVQQADARAATLFWQMYRANMTELDAQLAGSFQADCKKARIAALMQILAPQSAALRKGLVEYL